MREEIPWSPGEAWPRLKFLPTRTATRARGVGFDPLQRVSWGAHRVSAVTSRQAIALAHVTRFRPLAFDR